MPSPPRVLLVDDNEDSVEMLGELLRLWGFEIETATDGPTAIAAARAFLPHSVVADLGLPGMDGYELARHLRQIPELADTRLIALTGRGDDEARRASAAAGFEHHVLKPAEVMELRTLLEQRQRSQA